MLRIEHLRLAGMAPLSFEVPAGEMLAVLGPSGSGKTRLLRAIADLDQADASDPARGGGLVFLAGAERGEMSGAAWRRRVRFVAVEPTSWADTLRAELPPGAAPDRWLQRLDLPRGIADAPLERLSMGERRRLALVRALHDDPRVLLLDEPTALLAAEHAALVEELLRGLTAEGRIVVFATHDRALATRLAHAELHLADPGRSPDRRRVAA
jgi:ABC-type lipoprotein export system ATPase subunit